MNSRLHDDGRIASIQRSLGEHNLDAFLVSLPRHVLMLTGYYPVVGTSLAISTREGQVGLLAPEDEKQFAQRAGTDQVEYFKPVTLDEILPLAECVIRPLRQLTAKLELKPGRIGLESGPASEPSSYSASNFYGPALREFAGEVWPSAEFIDAQPILRQLCAVKTPNELRHIRTACSLAAVGFERGRTEITSGISEMQLAACFSSDFAAAAASAGIDRQHAFLYCMSGPNSAHAYYAYAHSTARKLGRRDWVLAHCNSHAGGYWTDITRTYVMGEHTERHREMFHAVLEARDAALAAIHPGAKASSVDSAARDVIEKYGFEDAFKHQTGHGVGFGAINAHALPRIHPKSDDVLEPGMVFNIEPAVYREGFGGVRQCEMVAVTEGGAELLTPFHSNLESLVIDEKPRRASRLRKVS